MCNAIVGLEQCIYCNAMLAFTECVNCGYYCLWLHLAGRERKKMDIVVVKYFCRHISLAEQIQLGIWPVSLAGAWVGPGNVGKDNVIGDTDIDQWRIHIVVNIHPDMHRGPSAHRQSDTEMTFPRVT